MLKMNFTTTKTRKSFIFGISLHSRLQKEKEKRIIYRPSTFFIDYNL